MNYHSKSILRIHKNILDRYAAPCNQGQTESINHPVSLSRPKEVQRHGDSLTIVSGWPGGFAFTLLSMHGVHRFAAKPTTVRLSITCAFPVRLTVHFRGVDNRSELLLSLPLSINLPVKIFCFSLTFKFRREEVATNSRFNVISM